ncbi:hypothetical protein GUJ93_ZPchr0008g11804 [Zizania palustris]|uniref:Glutaredoxin domain-containing protein n=1 Tax=Zizania palustris TaxID=103762 RepID=A0A8J5VJH9_ZIZPA|nr:hypothetical protein GUJ93_ZPchr0008g11804 [Zizania palustris]
MGCSSSRYVRGDVVKPAPERSQSLSSRSVSRNASSALSSVGICRGRHDNAVHAYSSLPLGEPSKGALPGGEAAGVPAIVEVKHDVPRAPANASPGGPHGLKAALLGDVSSAASSGTAQWRGSFDVSSPAPQPEAAVQVGSLPGFDQAIMSGFRDIKVEPSPSHPSILFPEHENPTMPRANEETAPSDDKGTPAARDFPEVTAGFVRARVDEFHRKIEKRKASADNQEALDAKVRIKDVAPPHPRPPARAGKTVVVYFTSLRGVRRTFEDGRAVRAILRCHRVRVDERDVSMHAAFKAELRYLLGAGFPGPTLPRVFVDGRHDLGDADDVRALHETGELSLALAGCEHVRPGPCCAACGDMRFLPCQTCYGSCKVFAGDEGIRASAPMFRRCPDCNENGLTRCPVCCY